MKECDILRGQNILTLPTDFQGSEPPHPQDLRRAGCSKARFKTGSLIAKNAELPETLHTSIFGNFSC